MIGILALIIKASFGQQFTDLRGDYFGQTPPGDSAEIFARGIISLTDRDEGKIVFSPDGREIFFEVFINRQSKIYQTKRVNNSWTEQVEVPFPGNSNVGLPFFSADENRLYFTNWAKKDIYRVECSDGVWGEMQPLPPPYNTSSSDICYTATRDGVVYLSSRRQGGSQGYSSIWSIQPSSTEAMKVVSFPDADASEPFVAPDGSYLIFRSDRPGGYGVVDLYICFSKGNNAWTAPVNMEKSNAKINIAGYHQLAASLSPDGKYLFFGRHNNLGKMFDIYWVSTHIIDVLRDAAFSGSPSPVPFTP